MLLLENQILKLVLLLHIKQTKMSKDEIKFQKAFLHQIRETLRGNYIEAARARSKVFLYRKKLEEKN